MFLAHKIQNKSHPSLGLHIGVRCAFCNVFSYFGPSVLRSVHSAERATHKQTQRGFINLLLFLWIRLVRAAVIAAQCALHSLAISSRSGRIQCAATQRRIAPMEKWKNGKQETNKTKWVGANEERTENGTGEKFICARAACPVQRVRCTFWVICNFVQVITHTKNRCRHFLVPSVAAAHYCFCCCSKWKWAPPPCRHHGCRQRCHRHRRRRRRNGKITIYKSDILFQVNLQNGTQTVINSGDEYV